ncbi:hypothetical protein PLEOSDRAFT_1106869 [Pleurotus ostreatus PC15]|uniref:HTH CENPB-type domain-containing protein n=1 Tax=Pleurotus ostreatus (strain PC15) TaxID=1137138 RepID=A0A067NQR6_PLEO1|nr:hypothetical protein PLEOSDRAFT_1106869 [Pleurotus ostreatus PC15]
MDHDHHDHHDHHQHHPHQWPTLDFTRHADLNNHEYPSPASPAYSLTYPHAQDFHDPSSSTATGAQFDQIPASTGPHRYRTRYSQRAAEGNQPQNAPRRYPEQPSESSRDSRQATSNMYYNMMLPGPSRPQTPSGAQASLEPLNPPPSASDNTSTPFPERESLSLAIGASGLQDPMRSPQFPLTPASTSSSSSSSGFNSRVPSHLLPNHHSRSDSSSTSNPRSASPALSVASALTSVSSSTSAPPSSASGFPALSNLGSNGGVPQPIPSLAPPRAKQRKQRLFNVDRKAICQYHRDNPNARQEDIAARYGVERSTISKILKHRSKWLNYLKPSQLRVTDILPPVIRPSKFPLIELELVAWLAEATASNTSLSDAMIRSKARDIARELNIGEDKFKASSGWVENFKHRNGIRGGKWHKLAKFGRLIPKEPTNTGMNMMGGGMGRNNGMGHNVGMSHQSIHRDDPMDGDEPSSAMTDHISLALQPAWPTASERQHHSSQQSSSSDLDGYHHHHGVENQHDPPQHVHHSQDDMHMHQSVIDPQLQHIQHDPPAVTMPVLIQGAPAVYIQTQSGQEIYHTDGPRLPTAPRQPTLADAEEAIDTLITFLETAGKGIVNPDERDALTQVKCALFQAGSGVPYDRGG